MLSTIKDKNEWNSNVLKLNGSFLQSWEWGEFQKSLGRSVERLLFQDKDGKFLAQIIKHRLPFGFCYFYVPRGPLNDFAIQNLEIKKNIWLEFLNYLKNLANREKAIFLRIEPEIVEEASLVQFLKNLKFLPSFQTVQPKITQIIDLTKSEEQLLKEMEYQTRYRIRAAIRRGVTIQIAESQKEKEKIFTDFWKLLKKTSQHHRFKTYPISYYKKVLEIEGDLKTKIFSAYFENKPISAAVFAFFNKKAYYLYSGSLSEPEYRRLNAPTLILWKAFLKAKEEKCQTIDLWDVRPSAGYSNFKKTFGGETINYIGTWDFVYNPVLYGTYKILKKFL